MEDKRFYWLKLKRDFFMRPEIRIVEAMPDGKDFILFYLKLLCESVDHSGSLRFSEDIPYTESMLATITNIDEEIARKATKVFSELRMIDILEDGTYFMNDVDGMTGSETAWAEKKRKYRETPKSLTDEDNVLELSGQILPLSDKSKNTDKDKDSSKERGKREKARRRSREPSKTAGRFPGKPAHAGGSEKILS